MISEFDFTFCPRCGGTLEKKKDNLLLCQNCDLHYYVNPRVSNAVLITNDAKELLLVKRKYNPYKGYWDLPGGFVDINETIEDSVQREMQEELGLRVNDLQYHSSFPDRYQYGGIDYYTVCAAFTASLPKNASIQIADDVEEVMFIQPKDIDLDHIAFDAIRNLLQNLKP